MKQFNKKTYFDVEYYEIEELIKEIYGKEYEIVALEEWNNDSSHEFNIKKEELSEYDKDKLNLWLNTKQYQHYILYPILTDMCNNDHIPEGDYLINVCW